MINEIETGGKINCFGAENDREMKEKGTCGSHLKKKTKKQNKNKKKAIKRKWRNEQRRRGRREFYFKFFSFRFFLRFTEI